MEDLKKDTQVIEEKNSDDTIKDTQPKNEDNNSPDTSNQEERTFTQDQVDEIVTKRLKREREKLSKILDEENFDRELLEREKRVEKREIIADAKEKFFELGLPNEFFELVNTDSREAMEASIESIKKINNEVIGHLVSNEVNQRLRGKTPSTATGTSSKNNLGNAFKHPLLKWLDDY